MTTYLMIFTTAMSILVSVPMSRFGILPWILSASLFFYLFYFLVIRNKQHAINIYNTEFTGHEAICLKSLLMRSIIFFFYLMYYSMAYNEISIFGSLFCGIWFSLIISSGYRYRIFYSTGESETWNTLKKLLKAYQTYHGITPP